MKYWIDVTCPPHVHFFRSFIRRAEKSGNEVLVTSRKFGVMNDMLDKNGIEYVNVGSHGGKDLESKLIHSSERVIELTGLISKEEPDIALSKHSIECARVSFGLGIPSVMVIDHETAAKQSRLTAPITDVVVSPKATDMKRLQNYGAKKIIGFYGVCETAHFHDFKPSDDVLKDLGLGKGRIIIARNEPCLASHNFCESSLFGVLDGIKSEYMDSQIVFIPRGKKDAERFSRLDVIIPEEPIDTLSLYKHADLMVGAGSCMNREAAIGGCPTISICPDKLPGVDKFLIKKRVMRHANTQERALTLAKNILKTRKRSRGTGEFLKTLDDPYEAIEKAVDSLLK